MGLYEKIYNVMVASEGLEKDLIVGKGANSYKAVGEKEVLNQLKPLFKAQRLIIFPIDGDISENNSSVDSTYEGTTTTKSRNITQLKVKFKIVDIDSGENEIIVGFGNGADSQDKGSGKAFTYSLKTALSKTFMLFSGEDTDNEHSDDIDKKNTATKPAIQKTNMPPPPQKTDDNNTAISDFQRGELSKLARTVHKTEETAIKCVKELLLALQVGKMNQIPKDKMTYCNEFITMWDDTDLPFTLAPEGE